jgi:hypothetical protein
MKFPRFTILDLVLLVLAAAAVLAGVLAEWKAHPAYAPGRLVFMGLLAIACVVTVGAGFRWFEARSPALAGAALYGILFVVIGAVQEIDKAVDIIPRCGAALALGLAVAVVCRWVAPKANDQSSAPTGGQR